MKRMTITMQDVARLAGVSQTTVSLILNQAWPGRASFPQETIDRVYAAAEQLSYKPKHAPLPEQNSKTIMVLMANPNNPYYTAMLSSIEDACYSGGYQVVSCCTYHNMEVEQQYLQMAMGQNYLGVILLSPPDNPRFLETVSPRLPMVIICDRLSRLETDIVELNNRLAGEMAAAWVFTFPGCGLLGYVMARLFMPWF